MLYYQYGCTGFDYLKSSRCRTWLDFGIHIQLWLDPDLGTSRFSCHRIIRLMKLMASTMLSAAIKWQYTVQCFLCCVNACQIWDEICGTAMNFVFFIQVTLIKIANTPLNWSAAFVLYFYPYILSILQQLH